jgi:hypothetical protein
MAKVRSRVNGPRTVVPAEESAVMVEEVGPREPRLPPDEFLPPERELWRRSATAARVFSAGYLDPMGAASYRRSALVR